ncbi:MAG: hypothetical protein H6815_13385 [Phycisphaeraceae bacterium]|nr:hypothetical protein [Phycisphaerales bacterium]MCB9861431.1 hypothetical protein [Phycisphaeraceae bacterium]
MKRTAASLSALCCLLTTSFASAQSGAWTVLPTMPGDVLAADAWIRPDAYAALSLDVQVMRDHLAKAPLETVGMPEDEKLLIVIPDPTGRLDAFRIVESPVMQPGLAAQLPDTHTFVGRSVTNGAAKLRMDITPLGFHAQVLAPGGNSWYVDPVSRDDTTHYASYYRNDLTPANPMQCLVNSDPAAQPDWSGSEDPNDAPLVVLRTYVVAMACTGEFTSYYGNATNALNGIVTGVNRITGIYERDFAVRLMLAANNNLVVYTNASTDPFNNNNPSQMLNANAGALNPIGSANYDVGHALGNSNSGGIASLGCVCTSAKAQGASCYTPPTGDPYWVDYVAHEMGHQFSANHNFNGGSTCGGAGPASKLTEPGSGSTIMGYAGLCGSQNNLQSHSDDMFGYINIDEVKSFIGSTGNSCATPTATGNNTPVVSPLTSYTIPIGTPFELTAVANDPDGDTLTYSWEGRDTGPTQNATLPDNGSSPLFRAFDPTTDPTRIIPKLQQLLNNTTMIGEKLPQLNRTMKMRVVVRDNNPAGGGTASADVNHIVTSSAGPFVVTNPNSSATQSGTTLVTWSVANTNVSPVNATNVDIYLSTDGGVTFPTLLLASTPNDGLQEVTMPNISTNTARIKVKASNNIFFDISNTNFSIVPALCYPDCDANGTLNVFDYICFGNAYSIGHTYADCDNNGTLNVFDYICFGNAYANGCP